MAVTILSKIEERDNIGKVSFDIDVWKNEIGETTSVNIEFTLTSEIYDTVSHYVSEMQNDIFNILGEVLKDSNKSYTLVNQNDITEMMTMIVAEKGQEYLEKILTKNKNMDKVRNLFNTNTELADIKRETTNLILESVDFPDDLKQKIIEDWEKRLTSAFINHSIENINKMGL